MSRTCGMDNTGMTPLWPLQPSALAGLRQPLSSSAYMVTDPFHMPKTRQMPLIYQLQPQPTPTSQQHFSASLHHPDHHPDTLTSTAARLRANLCHIGNICYAIMVVMSVCHSEVDFTRSYSKKTQATSIKEHMKYGKTIIRDRLKTTRACSHKCTQRHRHRRPWSILWPVGDLTAQQLLAVWCFTLRITFHFQTIQPIEERQSEGVSSSSFYHLAP